MQENYITRNEEVDEWAYTMFLYNSALKKINTKIEILKEEFRQMYRYNPIEHVSSRIKTPESIVKKLRRHNKEISIKEMVESLNDIAGIRIICSFTPDIYQIATMLSNQEDIHVLSVKDYFEHPKENGYRSYHMIVTIPIYVATGTVQTKVEIQIRTIAMDFWASLEHKIHYKFEGNAPKYMYSELKNCAEIAAKLDEKMLALNNTITQESAKMPPSTDTANLEHEIEQLAI